MRRQDEGCVDVEERCSAWLQWFGRLSHFLLPTISREFTGFAAKDGVKGMEFEIKQPCAATCQPCPWPDTQHPMRPWSLRGKPWSLLPWVMPCHHNILALYHCHHFKFCTSTYLSVNGNIGLFPMTLRRDKWVIKGIQLMLVKKHTKLFESQFPLLYNKEKNTTYLRLCAWLRSRKFQCSFPYSFLHEYSAWPLHALALLLLPA